VTSAREWIASWVDGVSRLAGLVVVLSLLLTGLSGWYAVSHLAVDTDNEDMLSADLPFRQDAIRLKQAFPQLSDNIVIVIDGATADQADDAAIALARALRSQLALFRTIFDPRGDLYFRRNGLLFLSEDELNDLVDRMAAAQAFIGKLSQDPSLRGLLGVLTLALDNADQAVSPDELTTVLDAIGKAIEAERTGGNYILSWQGLLYGGNATAEDRRRLIVVQPTLDYGSLQPAEEAMAAIRATADKLGLTKTAGIRLRLTGSAPLEQEELGSVAEGMGLAGIISLTLVLILLFIGLRSGRLVGAVLVTLVMGLIWTAAFATLAVGRLNLISVAFAVLFIGLSVDFGIHFVLRVREAMALDPAGAAALHRAARDVGGALTLCAVAAAISFFSFLPTDYVGLAELGIIAGSGMFIALFANLTVLPALLALLPPKIDGAPGNAVEKTVSAVAWQVRHAKTIVGAAVLLAVGSAMLLPQARFDFDPLNLRDPSTESVRTLLDLMGNADRAPYTASVLVGDAKTAQSLSRRLASLTSVDSVLSIEKFVPQDQEDKLAIIESAAFLLLPALQKPGRASPTDVERKTAFEAFRRTVGKHSADTGPRPAEYAAALKQLSASLQRLSPGAIDLQSLERRLLTTLGGRLEALKLSLEAEPVTLADVPANLRARYLDARGQARLEIFPKEDLRDPASLRRFVDDVRGVAPRATGSPVIIVEAGKAVVDAFATAGLISVVVIGGLIIVLLRRVRDVFLVFAPLFLAALLTVASSVILALPFNFANVIVLPLLFGLGVASSIHFVLRQRTTHSLTSLLDTSTPRAVFFSALTTIGSFASIALSSHPGTASMGVLLTIAISLTLLCTVVVLPALMAVLNIPVRAEA
jgi:hopanoid biosynthesis associated RND transporter like protein HpnN